MKKAVIFTTLAVILALVFSSTFLVTTTRKVEAMALWQLMLEMICSECAGNFSQCCYDKCYTEIIQGSHTNGFPENLSIVRDCQLDCVSAMLGYCH